MATPNYGFEKRQKELAKKRKKEEKLKTKAVRKHGGVGDDGADSADAQGDQPSDAAADTGGNAAPAAGGPPASS